MATSNSQIETDFASVEYDLPIFISSELGEVLNLDFVGCQALTAQS